MFLMVVMLVGVIIIELDFAQGFQKYIIFENFCQEPPHTWRITSILLRFLMVIMMAGVIFLELDFA